MTTAPRTAPEKASDTLAQHGPRVQALTAASAHAQVARATFGVSGVFLHVEEANTAAVQLYRKEGCDARTRAHEHAWGCGVGACRPACGACPTPRGPSKAIFCSDSFVCPCAVSRAALTCPPVWCAATRAQTSGTLPCATWTRCSAWYCRCVSSLVRWSPRAGVGAFCFHRDALTGRMWRRGRSPRSQCFTSGS